MRCSQMDTFKQYAELFYVAMLIGICATQVSASDTRILWSLDDELSARSCVFSLSGDPTDWIPKLNIDDEYGVVADPLCVDRSTLQIGHLTANPAQPDVVVASDMLDNSFLYLETTHEGNAKTFFGGAKNVTGIALDYQSQNVYYTDPNIGLALVQFGVSRPYFSILLEGLDQPHSVHVDPDQGYVFWAEFDVIKRSLLTGESETTIMTGISTSTLVTLDRENHKLIVLDQHMAMLRSLDYDGHKVTYLLNDTDEIYPGKFSGLSVHQGYVLGVVADEATIVIWNQTTGERLAKLNFPVSKARQYGITTSGMELMKRSGPCMHDNGGCSQICVHQSIDTRVCMCGLGYTLTSDGASCTTRYLQDNFLLISDIGSDKLYQIDLNTAAVHAVPTERTSNQRMEAMDYDPNTKTVIWVDTGNGTLRSRILEHGSTERIVFTFPTSSVVEGITFNPADGYVYYTDFEQATIGRVSLNDSTQEIIISFPGTEKPLLIKHDAGYIYWTNVGTLPSIERAKIADTKLRDILVTTDIEAPTGLVIDLIDSKIFWSDQGTEKVETANLDGSARQMVQATEAIYSMAMDMKYLYTIGTHEVRRYSKAENPQSTMGPRAFSILHGMHLYSSALIPTTPDGSGAAALTGDLHHAILFWIVIVIHL